MSNREINAMLSGIQGMQKVDPRTYDALRQMIQLIQDHELQLNPITRIIQQASVIIGPVVNPPNFAYSFLPTGIRFSWDIVANALLYELRRGPSTWELADFVLRTSSNNVVVLPLVAGSYKFHLKSINAAGTESTTASEIIVTIPLPDQVSPVATVVDNNVLLQWTAPSSPFAIDYYEISRNSQFFGTTRSTFTVIFESTAGSYTYGFTAVDIAGNRSTENFILVTVNQPPDYVLDDQFISNLTGARVNVYVTT